GTGNSQRSAHVGGRCARIFHFIKPACAFYRPRPGELGVQGELMPTADRGRRPPAHAGKLRPWERFTITLVFTVVAAAVIAVSVYGSRTHHPGRPPSAAGPRSSGASPVVQRPGAGARPSIPGGLGHIDPASESGGQVLAGVLAPVLRRYGG